jgi:hypothetical protein
MRTAVSSTGRQGAIIAAIFVGIVLCGTTARAGLVIEPVFNRVAGSGPTDNNFPLYDPTYLVNGVSYWLADEPGEVDTFATGDPRDPELDVLHVWNNTRYNLTGFSLRLIGTATDTRDPGTVVREAVDAVWGDVDGDGRIGSSDIFRTITVSADGKEITFGDGLIPVDGRFTDIMLAHSDHPPDFAGVDSWFSGVQSVPEPSSLALASTGLLVTVWCVRRRRRGGGGAGIETGPCS